MTRQIISNLSKGEIGPELYGRIDTPQYAAGAKRVSNFIVQRYGGLSFRPGFRFVGEADDVETPIRYVPFDYALGYSYVLPLAEMSFRPLTAGGFILEENLQIISITQEYQALVEIHYHSYAIGKRIFFNGVTGMTEINGQFGTVVAVPDIHHVRVDIDTTAYSPFTASDGTDRVGAPPSPPPPPPPPPPAPAPPDPPATGGGGGSGGGLGGYGGGGNVGEGGFYP